MPHQFDADNSAANIYINEDHRDPGYSTQNTSGPYWIPVCFRNKAAAGPKTH